MTRGFMFCSSSIGLKQKEKKLDFWEFVGLIGFWESSFIHRPCRYLLHLRSILFYQSLVLHPIFSA